MLPSTILSVILYSASVILLIFLPFVALVWQILVHMLLGQNELSDDIAGYGVIVITITGIIIAIAIGLSNLSVLYLQENHTKIDNKLNFICQLQRLVGT